MKSGARLRSQVDDTQVIIVKFAESLLDLRCGGMPMIELDAEPDGDSRINPEYRGGTLMGKRYVDESGAEVLVTKAGTGTLSIGVNAMQIKEAKPLPASD